VRATDPTAREIRSDRLSCEREISADPASANNRFRVLAGRSLAGEVFMEIGAAVDILFKIPRRAPAGERALSPAILRTRAIWRYRFPVASVVARARTAAVPVFYYYHSRTWKRERSAGAPMAPPFFRPFDLVVDRDSSHAD